MRLKSYVYGQWIEGEKNLRTIKNAATGESIYEISSDGVDFRKVLEYARDKGTNSLSRLTFHQRAKILKETAKYLSSFKADLYPLSYSTGATKFDSWLDIDGGIQTFFSYSGKGKREFPDEIFYVDGDYEPLSKSGSFIGQHIFVPLTGTAVHINAFNFPCWGMMEKLAPTFLGGMSAVVKPASSTAFLTEAVVKLIINSDLLPEGALQLICGSTGDLFEYLTGQDVVTFTGSAETGRKLKAHHKIIENAVRFNMEADSLNCSVLGPDAVKGTPEFQYFIREVVNEMTIKAGQKCTAIRRTLVPASIVEDVSAALKDSLEKVKIGFPSEEGIRMGPLVDEDQVTDVFQKVELLRSVTESVYGGSLEGTANKGAYFAPVLLYTPDPFASDLPHSVEAFGPVNTLMPYTSEEELIKIARKGGGSLVASIFTSDADFARNLTLGIAPYHGRIMIIDAASAKESTGHGSPLPNLTHGGPGRAGGGEEMGGKRGVFKYMQRTALQGSPYTLSHICSEWVQGADKLKPGKHPFMKYFEELEIGETLITHGRTVTEADIVNFAGISGDYFYAHMNEPAAKRSIFEKRVAHGYFVLSAAAGLFVHPAEGPVLANYGLDNLRFTKPVYPGDTITAKLTCRRKTAKEPKENEPAQGVVSWHVEVQNQDTELVAVYDILTLVRSRGNN